MITWFLLRAVGSMEREYGYDATYLRELARTDRAAFIKFALATRLSFHRKGVPAAAWHAAKITTARAEDCGPCTQLAVDMALKEGMSADIVTAILMNDEGSMGEDAAVGWRLARGVAEKRSDLLAAAIEEAQQRWGRQGHASLAVAITGTRLYPTLKAGLGHAMACHKIMVGGQDVQPSRDALHVAS